MALINFTPLIEASTVIMVHTGFAVAALLLGGYVLAGHKGTRAHRWAGRVWVAMMAFAAASSLFVFTIRLVGPFSPIHVLLAITLITLWSAVRAAQTGAIRRHQRQMQFLYFGALIGPGIFTMLPGRIMHDVLVVPALAHPVPVIAVWAALGASIWGAIVLRRRTRETSGGRR